MAKLRKGSKVRKLKRGGSGTAEEEELEKFGKEYGVDTHGSMQKGGKTRKSKRGGAKAEPESDKRRAELELSGPAGAEQQRKERRFRPWVPRPGEGVQNPPVSLLNPPPIQQGGKTRKSKRKSNKKTKRKMNGFMKMMLDAKKHNKPSFVYKGKKYKQGKTKTGLVIYKKG